MKRTLQFCLGSQLFVVGLTWLAIVAIVYVPCHAQPPDDDPFGAPTQPTQPPDDPMADPDQPPAAQPRRPAAARATTDHAVAQPSGPAALAVLESKPQTPAELLRAITILVDLGQAPFAKEYAQQLVQQPLDPATKAGLVRQFRSPTLYKLARQSDLAAVLGPWVENLLKTADLFRVDPQQLAWAAASLNDPNQSTRARATVTLLDAHEAAVAPLVAVLADPDRQADHAAAMKTLVALGSSALAPLLGVLDHPDEALQARVVEVLGHLRLPQAVPYLLGPMLLYSDRPAGQAASRAVHEITGRVPSTPEALEQLAGEARRSLEQSRQDFAPDAPPVAVWHWHPRQNQSVPVQLDPRSAALDRAATFGRVLYQVNPENTPHRHWFLIALLQVAKYRHGLDQPMSAEQGWVRDFVAAQGADDVENALVVAMRAGFFPAAAAAAEILGEIAGPEILARGAVPSPLAVAAASSDRRLRYAAIAAIMRMNPTQPFPGSSQVVEGLGFLASSFGTPRVLIVHPLGDQAQSLAGLAMQLGYDADAVTNGRQAFHKAIASPDYEFVLIHSSLVRPAADELIAQLRRDTRTSALPIGLMSTLEDMERVKKYAVRTPLIDVSIQPRDLDELKLFGSQVLTHADRLRVSPGVRKAQALAALGWMTALSAQPNRAFDLRTQERALMSALAVPDLTASAATVLGQIGSREAQRRLIELANFSTQRAQVRQAAAAAFVASVRRFGLMLTRGEIMKQYDLYNANAGHDGQTHVVLTTILDAIEGRGQAAGS